MIYIKKIMKRPKIKLINILVIIVAVMFIFIILNIYKQSPRHIIKDTVMWYEKDFTIPLFCKKVKFEYDRETGKYTGKFLITKKQADRIYNKWNSARKRYCDSIDAQNEHSCDDISELSEKILNTTAVSSNLMYKTYMGKVKKRDDIDFNEIYPENWMIEDEDALLLLYWTQPQTGYDQMHRACV